VSTLLVFTFAHENGAQEMIRHMQTLQRQQLINIADAATVIRQINGKVKVKQANNLVGVGALGGAFWGLMIGLLLWESWRGTNLEPGFHAFGQQVSDCGLDAGFIKEVSNMIQPGHSALFLLVEQMTGDKVMTELQNHQATMMRANLNIQEETRLREAFGVPEMG
jgi:uncharacterized membrane protein